MIWHVDCSERTNRFDPRPGPYWSNRSSAGLDDSTWVEAVGREPDERGLVEIVKRCEAMLPDGRI
jgi:hypothetical protein